MDSNWQHFRVIDNLGILSLEKYGITFRLKCIELPFFLLKEDDEHVHKKIGFI
jgi:hypothetical protein